MDKYNDFSPVLIKIINLLRIYISREAYSNDRYFKEEKICHHY